MAPWHHVGATMEITLDKNGSLYDPAGTESWNMQIRYETMKLTMHPTNNAGTFTRVPGGCLRWPPTPPGPRWPPALNLELERERTKEEKEREVLHLFRCYTHTRARATSPVSFLPWTSHFTHSTFTHNPFTYKSFAHRSFTDNSFTHTHHSFTDNSFTHSFAYNFDTLNSFHTPRFHTNLSNTSLPHTTFLTYRSSTTSFFFPPCPVRFNWFWLLEEVHLWGYPVLYLFEIMKSR